MGLLDGLFGVPKPSGETGREVVKAREFDITQYGKKLTVFIAVLVPAIVAALKALGVEEISETMVIASLAVTAVAVFCATLLMAVDMIARALVTRGAADDDPPLEPDEEVHRKTKETRVSRA
jgi:hypothetical protein